MEQIASFLLLLDSRKVEEHNMDRKGVRHNGTDEGQQNQEGNPSMGDEHRDKQDTVATDPMSVLVCQDEKPFENLPAANQNP